jgi:hypothetical protein
MNSKRINSKLAVVIYGSLATLLIVWAYMPSRPTIVDHQHDAEWKSSADQDLVRALQIPVSGADNARHCRMLRTVAGEYQNAHDERDYRMVIDAQVSDCQ